MVYIKTQFKCIKMLSFKKIMQSSVPNQVFSSALAGPISQFINRMEYEKFCLSFFSLLKKVKSELLAVYQYHPLFSVFISVEIHQPPKDDICSTFLYPSYVLWQGSLKITLSSSLCLMKTYVFISSRPDPMGRRSNYSNTMH